MDVNARWEGALRAYRLKVRTAASNSWYVVPGFSTVDMEQELLVVLWQCCKTYDPAKGANFGSYFWMCAKQRIGQLKARASAKKRTATVISLDQDAMQWAVDAVTSTPSAEEEALAWVAVQEHRQYRETSHNERAAAAAG